jgi:sulfate transport system permease protein
MIMSQLQEYDYASATSIALVMLAIAFVILPVNAVLPSMVSKRVSGIS